MTHDYGRLEPGDDGRWVLRFTRQLPAPAEEGVAGADRARASRRVVPE